LLYAITALATFYSVMVYRAPRDDGTNSAMTLGIAIALTRHRKLFLALSVSTIATVLLR